MNDWDVVASDWTRISGSWTNGVEMWNFGNVPAQCRGIKRGDELTCKLRNGQIIRVKLKEKK